MYWKGLPLSSAKITKDKHRILFRQVTLHFHILYKSSENEVQKKEFYLFFLLNRTLYPNTKKHHKGTKSISVIFYSNRLLIKKPRRIAPGIKKQDVKIYSSSSFSSNRPSSNPDACCMASLKFFSINLAPLVIDAFIKRPCKRPISTKSSSVSLSLYSS